MADIQVSEPTVRMVDVARRAGVSTATVSRVLNNTGPVTEQTRARVRAAIDALGYVHTTHAHDDAPVEARKIAVFVTDIVNPIFAEVLRGIEDEIGSSGTAAIVQSVAEHLPPEKHPLRLLELHHVDGVIAFTSHIPEADLIAIHERFKLPLVVINLRVNHPSIPSIVVDFENGAYRSAQHLLKLNHTRIAYLAGLPTSQTSRQRRKGIERALAEAGASLPSSRVVDCFPSVEGGFQAMSMLLELAADDRPTAVIAYNDLLALGALHAIRVHGLNVPEHISVVGFDNIALAAHSNPPLTTIDQPKYRMGRLAMQMLNNLIGSHTLMGRGYTLLECPLIIRESTAPYAGA